MPLRPSIRGRCASPPHGTNASCWGKGSLNTLGLSVSSASRSGMSPVHAAFQSTFHVSRMGRFAVATFSVHEHHLGASDLLYLDCGDPFEKRSHARHRLAISAETTSHWAMPAPDSGSGQTGATMGCQFNVVRRYSRTNRYCLTCRECK